MKDQLILGLAFLASTALLQGQANEKLVSAQSQSRIENEVGEAIRQRLDAVRRGDVKGYVSDFAEDCIVTSDDGLLIKPEHIAKEWAHNLQSGITFKGSQPLDLQVHVYGETVVASFRVDLDSDWAGQKVFEASRITDVFTLRGGRWLLVAHHETPIPNARRVGVKVDPNVFDSYAGDYQITPNYIVKVKREGDKLMDLWPDDSEYTEDMAVSESTFFARGEAGEITYVRGENGKVTHFVLRGFGGDLIAQKIK